MFTWQESIANKQNKKIICFERWCLENGEVFEGYAHAITTSCMTEYPLVTRMLPAGLETERGRLR